MFLCDVNYLMTYNTILFKLRHPQTVTWPVTFVPDRFSSQSDHFQVHYSYWFLPISK
jgi:hypothetical protein